jgi:hypothetical protein
VSATGGATSALAQGVPPPAGGFGGSCGAGSGDNTGGSAEAAGAGGSAGSDSALPGCPLTKPSAGQTCAGGPYYCFYFDGPTATCAHGVKCTTGGAPWAFSDPYPEYCNPSFSAEQCDANVSCGSVEPNGGCVVDCTRQCTCNPSSGVLECTPITC